MKRSQDDIYEELLVLRCQRRDADAWDELVQRYNDRLFYYVRRLIEDDDQSAQLVQEIWIHILRSLHKLRQSNRFTPWLYTIARRVVMTHFRQKYSSLNENADEIVEISSTDDPDSCVVFENVELVHFGLSRIGWLEREVLTLYFLEDLSTEEIAGVLEVPVGTVKSRLSRARSELRSVLEQETDDSAEEKN